MKILILVLFFPFALYPQSQFTAVENGRDKTNISDSDLKSIERIGEKYALQNNWEAALPYYEKLKNLSPNNADYHYKYGGVLAMIAGKSNKFTALSMCSDIRNSFQKALRLDPKHIDARWALIEYYLQLPGIFGGSEVKANSYANELLVLSPVDGYLAKGHVAEYIKKYQLAEKHYLKAIEIGQSQTTYQKLANLYKNKMNQPEKAKALLIEFDKKS